MITPTPRGKSASASADFSTRDPQVFIPEELWNTFAYEWDAQSGTVVLSGKFSQILGVREGEHVTGRQILPKVHPDDLSRIESAFASLTPGKPNTQISYRTIHPKRGVTWLDASGRALFDREGRVLRISGTVADMTGRVLVETQLVTANALLRLALEAGKSVGWDWDVKTGRDSWFGDLQTMFGIPSSTYSSHIEDFRRRIYTEDRGMVWKAVMVAMENKIPYIAEFRVVRVDGSLRWIAARGKFYYSATGEPERMLGIGVDITERKAAEEALQLKKVELLEAQRLAGVGSWQWDPQTDIVTWSDEMYRIAGRDPRLPAVSFAECDELLTPESLDRLRGAADHSVRTGAPYELELELIRPDGTTRWIIARCEVERGPAGQVLKLRGTTQDITEWRLAQEALRESEERLRLAAQAGRMYAFEWDRDSDVITRSAEFAHILGVEDEPKETTCKEMLASVHPDDRARVVATTEASTPENPSYQVQYRVIRKDGSVVWLEKNGHAFFNRDGCMYRAIGMVADITERRLAEETVSALSRRLIEAQEAERARIARDLHDDIGQRLALALVTLEQVRNAANSHNGVSGKLDDLRRQIAEVSRSVHNLSHQLHSATLRHLGVAKAIRGFCGELSEQQNVDINYSFDGIPGTITPEISLCLFRVVQEALHNAVKYSRVRQFDVELRGSHNSISLVVRDAGAGFDPEVVMKRSGGLGLVSMQERLKLVNGELSIVSRRNHGTVVRAHVPLVSSNGNTMHATP